MENGYKITFAKVAKIILRNQKKVLVLYNGSTLNNLNGSVSQFEFSKSDFIIDKSNNKTIGDTKTQENSTLELLSCIMKLNKGTEKYTNNMKSYGFNNCRMKNIRNIYQELYSRIFLPFYNLLLVMISLLLILKSKNDLTFNKYKYNIFFSGFLFIIFIEASIKLIGKNIFGNSIIFLFPFIFSLLFYLYLSKKLIIKKI